LIEGTVFTLMICTHTFIRR